MSVFVDVNGKVSKVEEASLPLFDRGFLIGDGCFEVLKVKKGEFVFLKEHLDRLFEGLRYLFIEVSFTKEELIKRMRNLVHVSRYQEAYFRVTVTRGSSLGFQTQESLNTNLYLFIKALSPQVNERVKLKLIQTSCTDRRPRIKTNSYQESLREIFLAKKEGYDDLLWVNSEGEITEASTSNVFFLERDGISFVTPHVSSGLLPGITRKKLIEFLKADGNPVVERVIFQEEIKNFSGAFLTSSIRGVVQVEEIGKLSFKRFLRKEWASFEKII